MTLLTSRTPSGCTALFPLLRTWSPAESPLRTGAARSAPARGAATVFRTMSFEAWIASSASGSSAVCSPLLCCRSCAAAAWWAAAFATGARVAIAAAGGRWARGAPPTSCHLRSSSSGHRTYQTPRCRLLSPLAAAPPSGGTASTQNCSRSGLRYSNAYGATIPMTTAFGAASSLSSLAAFLRMSAAGTAVVTTSSAAEMAITVAVVVVGERRAS